jgi:sarcosine oxidase
MKREFDTIVLGLGGLGAGALYWLSKRLGSKVLGLEQFEMGHVRGGSQDHSRIIRLSYHTPEYVEFARQAYQAWAEVEADSGETLVIKTGSLDLWPANPAYPMSLYTDSMDAAGVGYERLTAAEVMHRWPQFSLTDDITGIFQPDGGIATPIRSNAAHLRLARENGALVRDNVPVTAIRPDDDGVIIEAGGETYRCRHLVITAGAWTNEALAHFGRQLHLTVTLEQVTYYNSPDIEAFMPDRFPVWIWMDEPSFYGFPVYGEAGPKAAQDVGGDRVTADTRTFEPNERTLARSEAFLAQVIPGMLGEPIYTKTCLYTMPPDRDFVISALPEQPNVSVAVGAGHGYKFASLIGKILSELALDGQTGYHIEPFFIDRPILLEEDPELNFMC